jgi:hypothetical protein
MAAVAMKLEVVVVGDEYNWVEGSLCMPSFYSYGLTPQ